MGADDVNRAEQMLMALYDHEIAISELYGACADQFADDEEFWQDLSGQEVQHAAALEQLSIKVREGTQKIVVDLFSLPSIEASIAHIKKLIVQLGDDELNMIDALRHALHIEEGMIENRYFEVFEDDSPETVNVLQTLAEDSRQHAAEIRQAFLACKQKDAD